MIFATLANHARLANAAVLARSIKQYHPDAYTVLCLVGGSADYRHPDSFDEVVFISPKRPGEEHGSLSPHKAYFVHSLLQAFEQPIVYMDAQSRLYGPVTELLEEAAVHDIVAVPFLLEPQQSADDEIERLQNGFLDAGLLALRPTETAKRFASWWQGRVSDSYYGFGQELHSEHRWLSLAMTPFGIRLLKHPAYHLSAWNMQESRRRLIVEGEMPAVGGQPLRTACFDNLNGRLDIQLALSDNPHLHGLVHEYRQECEAVPAVTERS